MTYRSVYVSHASFSPIFQYFACRPAKQSVVNVKATRRLVVKLSVKAHDHMRSPTTFVNTLGAGCMQNVFLYILNIDVKDAFKKSLTPISKAGHVEHLSQYIFLKSVGFNLSLLNER